MIIRSLLGMSGFWGTKLTNDTCLAADWVLGLGTRFKEADCSSWYRNYTFNIPPTKLIHIDIEPQEIGRNFPTEIGVDRRPEAVAEGDAARWRRTLSMGRTAGEMADALPSRRKDFAVSNEAMATSDAFPMMPERILADSTRGDAARCDPHNRRRLEQERRRSAIPDLHARQSC